MLFVDMFNFTGRERQGTEQHAVQRKEGHDL